MENYAYLVFVSADENHNKFYEMRENQNGTITVKWGRVGTPGKEKTYDSWQRSWYSLKNEKEGKGYKDVTALHIAQNIPNGKAKEDLSYLPIKDKGIRTEIENFINVSRQFMKTNYTIKITDISQKMIDAADNKIEYLEKLMTDYEDLKKQGTLTQRNERYYVSEFNDTLTELFTAVPRKMAHVEDYLANGVNDFREVYDREVKYLDTVRTMYQATAVTAKSDKDTDVLAAYDIEMRNVTYDEEDYILDKLSVSNWEKKSNEEQLVAAYKVVNKKTEEKFKEYIKDEKIKPGHDTIKDYFHGTRDENVWSIIKTGMSLNPNAHKTGKALGQGLYLADKSQKSVGYTDMRGSRWSSGNNKYGYLLMFKTAIGKPYDIYDTSLAGSWFEKKDLPKGTNCLYYHSGKGGYFRDNEVVVFDERQVTVDYLVKLIDYDNRPVRTLGLKERKMIDFRGSIEALEKLDDNKYIAEVDIDRLSPDTKKILEKAGLDITGLNIIFENDTITFGRFGRADMLEDIKGDTFTTDDKKWIARQVKRLFAESEDKWKELMEKKPDLVEVRKEVTERKRTKER